MTKARDSFDVIFFEWAANRQRQNDVSDEEAERLNEQEMALLDQIVAMPVTNVAGIAGKVNVAKQLIEQTGSRWSDQRDVKVLESVLADLTRLGAQKAKPAA